MNHMNLKQEYFSRNIVLTIYLFRLHNGSSVFSYSRLLIAASLWVQRATACAGARNPSVASRHYLRLVTLVNRARRAEACSHAELRGDVVPTRLTWSWKGDVFIWFYLGDLHLAMVAVSLRSGYPSLLESYFVSGTSGWDHLLLRHRSYDLRRGCISFG